MPDGTSRDVDAAAIGLPSSHVHGHGHDADHDHLHELGIEHSHEHGIGWDHDNLSLVTVGIDIGSSTSHLLFGRVHLQRLAQGLSSRYVVVRRETLWSSDVRLTPYTPDSRIDAALLREFVASAYRDAGIDPREVEAGVVILTGEALKKSNTRAIGALFEDGTGRFVCATAGHHREAVLAAHGSGAGRLSREGGRPVLNVDVGGGTTKLALLVNGEPRSTAAVAVGGRLLTVDEHRRVTGLADPLLVVLDEIGLPLAVGDVLTPEAERAIVGAQVDVLLAHIRGDDLEGLADALLVTDPLARAVEPEVLTFSGGVAEYVYRRQPAGFGDLGPALGEALRVAVGALRPGLEVREPAQGIRATAVGLAQFSVQVSGNTISVGGALPARNVPVGQPPLTFTDRTGPDELAHTLARMLEHLDAAGGGSVALPVQWRADPSYERLHLLASGLADALGPPVGAPASTGLVVVLLDVDLAATLGHLIAEEALIDRPVVCLDSIDPQRCDFLDIGDPIPPGDVVPVLVKSLLFADHSSPVDRG